MPSLPFNITYKSKVKLSKGVSIRSPFSLKRGEASTAGPIAPPVPQPPHPLTASEVIDIHEAAPRYSLEIDGGKHAEEDDVDIVDQEEPIISRPQVTELPRVQLDIDISPDGLADWAANFLQSEGFSGLADLDKPKSSSISREEAIQISPRRMSTGTLGVLDNMNSDLRDDSDSEYSDEEEEDLLASLRAMEASHYGKLEGDVAKTPPQETVNKKHLPEPLVLHPKDAYGLRARDSLLSGRSSRQTSVMDSAVSGTTLARALFANSFLLSSDSRSSRYRSGTAGLTRTDSTTLPRGDYHLIYDGFPISPDAPPIPSNAEHLYEPPKKPRNTPEFRDRRKKDLKRRSSTGSLATRRLPDTPNTLISSRGNSGLLSPGAEFDLKSLLPKTPVTPDLRTTPSTPSSSVPRSPLPPTPQATKFLQSTIAFDQSSLVVSLNESTALPTESPPRTPDMNLLSPASLISDPPSSGKDFDGILSSYSQPDSPEPFSIGGPYRPVISPISEENSAQLSPPTPYRTRRESARMQPIGARSPMAGSIRRASTRAETLPIIPRRSDSRVLPKPTMRPKGERPLSSAQPQSHGSPTPSNGTLSGTASSRASVGSDMSVPLEPPPPLTTIFSRQRSGSLPSPIQVVRDSKDPTAYNLTISNGDGDTPTTEDGIQNSVTQEFPETPDPFSPLYTAQTDSSAGAITQILETQEITLPPMPSGPMSAALPSRPNGHTSLAQQVLLNRAGTTIGHMRHPSATKIQLPKASAGPSSSRRIPEISTEDLVEEQASPSDELEDSPLERLQPSSAFRPVSSSTMSTTTTASMYADMQANPQSENRHSTELPKAAQRQSSLAGSDGASMYTSASNESRTKMKSLPAIPTSPLLLPSPQTPETPNFSPEELKDTPSSSTTVPNPEPILLEDEEDPDEVDSKIPETPPRSASPIASTNLPHIPPAHNAPLSLPRTAPPPPPPRARIPPPALTFSAETSTSENTVAVNGTDGNSQDSSSSTHHAIENPPIATTSANQPTVQENSSNQKSEAFTGRGSDIFRATSLNLGSPPPYYSVVDQSQHVMTNYAMAQSSPAISSTSAASVTPQVPAPTIVQPPLNDHTPPRNGLNREDSISSQRSRIRPQLLPAGPRRPSMQVTLVTPAYPTHRDRNESISSLNSNHFAQTIPIRQNRTASVVPSPKFQTATPKFRGYTMEAAKWTFTSAQLQAIVSKAIRQSAEASSIRLLRLEVLENDIPSELQRLDAQRTDLKTRYKVLTRRRVGILEGLGNYVAEEGDNVSYGLRLVDELKELVVALDKLTEELHSLDNQIAHLESLTHLHNGSALAMALRKLNSSFLKQMAENQALKNEIQTLEAERDEAWQQAESVAQDFDKMVDGPTSNRSSHVSAKRKSSVRVSKAGLRSQRSSLGSAAVASVGLTFHSIRSPLTMERLPPIPRMPRRKPHLDLLPDTPLRSSAALSSRLTPTSENLALVRAQDELYQMLGLRYPERTIRRSRSVGSGLPVKSPALNLSHQQPPPPQPAILSALPSSQSPDLGSRRASLPGDSGLAETYNVMAADRNAILATIDMLSATD
ncbi:hypothetical protein CVT24_007194 [Panaeolus cyanescens]|uniref:Uncharacterized protein n=1 Tax=Panaeolus cyanescens TaxID=181874 RepID=A0A409VJK0_9AGAR|nr:hypothetical protein CVT24_007194 [Panaeolus cyanescens]